MELKGGAIMIYYRVKPEYDNVTRYKLNSRGVCVPDSVLIGNELYTAVERSKIANRKQMFDVVEIPKNKTFFSFGARFEYKDLTENFKEYMSYIHNN